MSGRLALLCHGCALVLSAGALQSLNAQSPADSVQAVTLDKLKTVIAAFEPARQIRWIRASGPFDLEGFYDKGFGGQRAWRFTSRSRTMAMQIQGQALTDSVVMRRTNLTPVSRHTGTTDSELLLATDDSMAHGLLTAGHQLVPLNIRLGAQSFLNYYSLRAALAGLPLARGWAGSASVLELGRDPVFSPVTLTVTGEEHISIGAGEFDCWHVAVKGPGIDETYWVANDTHDVIRTREPIGGQGAMLQLELLSAASK